MVLFLALRTLARQKTRTALTVLGLAVSTALLYDMALLSGGLRVSLARVLDRIGYELRVLPKESLPFSSEAELENASVLARDLAAIPGVADALPLYGRRVYVSPAEARGGAARGATATFALGLDTERDVMASVDTGRFPRPRDAGAGAPMDIVLNHVLADSLGVGVGDTLLVSAALDAVTGGAAAPERAVVSGLATFRLDLERQLTTTLRLADLQAIVGDAGRDRASFLLGRLEPGADAERVVARFRTLHPEVDAASVAGLLERTRGQLSYFQQFSLILGSVSLIVTFLLILTLLTLSVNERQGEIALLRAIGLRTRRVVQLVVLEGLAFGLLAAAPGIAIGSLASRGLDGILARSPGLPPALSFFEFTPGALLRTLALLVATAALAGAYPAYLAARTNIVATLHREVT
jgi:putative ABC transport system permease protein